MSDFRTIADLAAAYYPESEGYRCNVRSCVVKDASGAEVAHGAFVSEAGTSRWVVSAGFSDNESVYTMVTPNRYLEQALEVLDRRLISYRNAPTGEVVRKFVRVPGRPGRFSVDEPVIARRYYSPGVYRVVDIFDNGDGTFTRVFNRIAD